MEAWIDYLWEEEIIFSRGGEGGKGFDSFWIWMKHCHYEVIEQHC